MKKSIALIGHDPARTLEALFPRPPENHVLMVRDPGDPPVTQFITSSPPPPLAICDGPRRKGRMLPAPMMASAMAGPSKFVGRRAVPERLKHSANPEHLRAALDEAQAKRDRKAAAKAARRVKL